MPGILNPAKEVKVLLLNEGVFATTLLTLLLDRYGEDALSWHPTTRRMELEQDFHAEMPTLNGDKLNAAVDILTSDGFFKQVPKFVQYCNVLTGSHPSFGEFDPADAIECAWGITEAMLIYPPDEDEPFSEEIRHYVGKVLHDEGIKTPPDVLKLGIWDKGGADFSDMSIQDPEMFAAEFQVQSDESKEIADILRSRLLALFKELQSLPLENGNTEELLRRIQQDSRTYEAHALA